MSTIPIFTGIIQKGRGFNPDKPEVYFHYLSTLTDQEVELSIQKKRKHRSSPQNKLYWGVYIPLLAEATGFTDDEMHTALKLKFLRKEGLLTTARSTTSLSTEEFINYLKEIENLANSLGVYLPQEGVKI